MLSMPTILIRHHLQQVRHRAEVTLTVVFLIDEMVDLSRARGSFVESPTLDIHTSPLTDGQGKEILAAL